MNEPKAELTTGEWLRILTNTSINARQIALLEGCCWRTAQKIVRSLNKGNEAATTCRTDDYLKKYRGTDRRTELRLIYPETRL